VEVVGIPEEKRSWAACGSITSGPDPRRLGHFYLEPPIQDPDRVTFEHLKDGMPKVLFVTAWQWRLQTVLSSSDDLIRIHNLDSFCPALNSLYLSLFVSIYKG